MLNRLLGMSEAKPVCLSTVNGGTAQGCRSR
jgi:hypothetical protein